MKFDLTLFATYGLDYKVQDDVLYIKPQWTKSGKPSKQWSNTKTKRGKAILDYATAGDVSQLYNYTKMNQSFPTVLLDKSVITRLMMESVQGKHSKNAFNHYQ